MILPEMQAFLDEWARCWAPLPAGSGPAARRAHFETVAAAMRQPTPEGVRTREMWIEREGRHVRMRCFRPPPAAHAQPAMIYLPGGAFMQGSPETHWDITARLAARTGRLVYSVDYAKTPEHPFPAAVDDVRAVVAWLFDEAEAQGVDRSAIAIGGDSAGGNLSAAMTLAFRDTSRRLQAQLLVYPACDFRTDRDSHRENPDGPIITVAGMAAVNAMYCPQAADLQNPMAAPLLADSHQGLPPAFVAVAEHDPLRDSGIAYAQALQAAGVPVHLDHGAGLTHSYLRAMVHCAAVRERFSQMCDWLNAQPRT